MSELTAPNALIQPGPGPGRLMLGSPVRLNGLPGIEENEFKQSLEFSIAS